MLFNALRGASLRCAALPRMAPLHASATRSIFSMASRSRIVSIPKALSAGVHVSQPVSRSSILRILGQSRLHSSAKSSEPVAVATNATESSPESDPLPILPSPAVGGWLMASATLVLAIIVVGGVTRLTESGLSITEWKPITGVVPPLTREDWEIEFAKYKETPEFKLYVPFLLIPASCDSNSVGSTTPSRSRTSNPSSSGNGRTASSGASSASPSSDPSPTSPCARRLTDP